MKVALIEHFKDVEGKKAFSPPPDHMALAGNPVPCGVVDSLWRLCVGLSPATARSCARHQRGCRCQFQL